MLEIKFGNQPHIRDFTYLAWL